jgi:hypothetical protein
MLIKRKTNPPNPLNPRFIVPDDCHFIVKGSEHITRVISDYLLSRPPWKSKNSNNLLKK